MKTVYSIYGGEPVLAQENPVRPGDYLIPADSTEYPPPVHDRETQEVFYNSTQWEIKDIPQTIDPETGLPVSDPDPLFETDAPEEVPQYVQQRLEAYGTLAQQIEYITEHGFDAWKARVEEIKAMYPKPAE